MESSRCGLEHRRTVSCSIASRSLGFKDTGSARRLSITFVSDGGDFKIHAVHTTDLFSAHRLNKRHGRIFSCLEETFRTECISCGEFFLQPFNFLEVVLIETLLKQFWLHFLFSPCLLPRLGH